MAERRILVLAVDDDPAELALLRKLIPRLGYDLIEASNGREALDMVRERSPDLVLLDVLIPGLDGFGVCRGVRSQPELSGLPILNEAVETREGTVADLMGDGVFALFGAPIAHDDDPMRAVEAALEMQVRVVGHVTREVPHLRLQLGVGITTGEVVAGNVGSERRMHYAVVGDSVNVAARLQASAGPSQILVDKATYDEVRDEVIAQDVGDLRLAGRDKWVRAFNIIRLARAHSVV